MRRMPQINGGHMSEIHMRRVTGTGGGTPGFSEPTEPPKASDELMNVRDKGSQLSSEVKTQNETYKTLQEAAPWFTQRHDFGTKGEGRFDVEASVARSRLTGEE